MVNLGKWGITPNFKPKHVQVRMTKYSKNKARILIIPKNGRSFPLTKKNKIAFTFKKKKFTHKVVGNSSLAQMGKKSVLVTQGLQVIVEKI